MDNFGQHNFGDLKKQVKELLDLADSREIFQNLDQLKKTLILLQDRLEYCCHCNGPTYNNGVCTEHFTDN
jgi:hypothetical protein